MNALGLNRDRSFWPLLRLRHQDWQRVGRRLWSFSVRPLRIALPLLLACILAYGVWPYTVLWRLEQAAARNDLATLSGLVDLERVRAEILARLNKERPSAIGAVSDEFVDWLEKGIRRHGHQAIPALVTLEWVRDQLGSLPANPLGLWAAIAEAFFAAPDDLRVQIARAPKTPPLYLRLERQGLGWRLTMIHH